MERQSTSKRNARPNRDGHSSKAASPSEREITRHESQGTERQLREQALVDIFRSERAEGEAAREEVLRLKAQNDLEMERGKEKGEVDYTFSPASVFIESIVLPLMVRKLS